MLVDNSITMNRTLICIVLDAAPKQVSQDIEVILSAICAITAGELQKHEQKVRSLLEIEKDQRKFAEHKNQLKQKEEELNGRQHRVREQEVRIAGTESALNEREDEYNKWGERLNHFSRANDVRHAEFFHMICQREAALNEKEFQLDETAKNLQRRERHLAERVQEHETAVRKFAVQSGQTENTNTVPSKSNKKDSSVSKKKSSSEDDPSAKRPPPTSEY
jgi:DNA repair exonuclease SbcCD ATPase subunit